MGCTTSEANRRTGTMRVCAGSRHGDECRTLQSRIVQSNVICFIHIGLTTGSLRAGRRRVTPYACSYSKLAILVEGFLAATPPPDELALHRENIEPESHRVPALAGTNASLTENVYYENVYLPRQVRNQFICSTAGSTSGRLGSRDCGGVRGWVRGGDHRGQSIYHQSSAFFLPVCYIRRSETAASDIHRHVRNPHRDAHRSRATVGFRSRTAYRGKIGKIENFSLCSYAMVNFIRTRW